MPKIYSITGFFNRLEAHCMEFVHREGPEQLLAAAGVSLTQLLARAFLP